MDNSFFHQQESEMKQKSGPLTGFHIFASLLPLMRHSVNWLTGFFQLTEEEREDAGVYLGRLGDE